MGMCGAEDATTHVELWTHADPEIDEVDVVSFDFWNGTMGDAQAMTATGEETDTGKLRWELSEDVGVFGASAYDDVNYALRGWADAQVVAACGAFHG